MGGARVAVWAHRDVVGLDRLESADDVLWHPILPLRDALTASYDTDAHLSALVIYEEPEEGGPADVAAETQPRLNSAVLRPLREQGSEALVTAAFVDVDNPGHAAWETPEAGEAALLALLDEHAEGGVLQHAAVYLTRAGWRAVYELDPPVPAAYYAAMMGRPYADHTGDPEGLLGWFADAVGPGVDKTCGSPLRCYRAPRVLREGQPTDPLVLDLEGLDAGPLDVSAWLEGAKARKEAPSPTLVDVSRPPHEPLTPSAWAAAGLEGILRKRYPSAAGRPGLGPAIRNQKPWFGPGERNEATFQATCLLLELIYANEEPPDAQDAADFVYRAMAPCVISACVQGISSTDVHVALDELWAMVQKRIGVETSRVAARLSLRDAQEQARVAVGTASGTVDPDPVAVPYSPQPTADEMGLAPLIAIGSGYMVLDARDPDSPRYFPYTRNPHLVLTLLLKGCGDRDPEEGEGPLGLHLRTSDGRLRPMQNLVIDYAVQVTDVVIAHGTERPFLDVERSRLQIPGACALPVKARYDEGIARWLEAIGGDDLEALLDWLATLTRLDRPTCALYLEGDPGTGKGLFAACCTSVFGAGFNKFETAVSRFNAGLSRSPIVFLDEKANMKAGEQTSAAFRSLVAETEHRVEPKGQEVMTIRGAMRMIIAANNADALPLVGGHTQADIEAVTSRIRWLGVRPQAAQILRDVGGRDVTEAWVGSEGTPGTFAAHVRWLEENRTVTPGPRFIVEGRTREYHEYLALSADRLRVLHAVAKGILAGPNQAHAAGIDVEPYQEGYAGSVAVNSGALRSKWFSLTGERLVPSQTEITASLSALGGVAAARRNNLRVYLVPERYVVLACERLGLPRWTVEETIESMARFKANQSDGRGGKR